jgi:hypothetical protein
MNLSLHTSTRCIVGIALLGSCLAAASTGTRPAQAASIVPFASLVPTNNPHIFAAPVPPSTFEASKASAAELERYGLPTRPSPTRDPARYKQWLQFVSHARHAVVPSFTPRADYKFNASSSNWSGTVNTGPTNSFQGVQGIWDVPSIAPVDSGANASEWVGLDGWGNGQVEQMGTDSAFYCFWTCVAQNYAWAEIFPDPSVAISNFPVNPGDSIVTLVVAYQPYSAPWYLPFPLVHFIMMNGSTGLYTSFYWVAKYGCLCQSAEWIVERPAFNNVLTDLAAFGSVTLIDEVTWTPAQAGYGANSASNPFNPTLVNMVSNTTGHQLDVTAAPSVVSDQITWRNFR